MRLTDIQGTVRLANGIRMPYLGLGVYQVQEGSQVVDAVRYALEVGYRLVDTASMYQNEEGVGRAIAQSGLPRGEVFITTKVWNTDQGYSATLRAFEASLRRLSSEYIDLYLVHWPAPGKYADTWRALERLYAQGRVRAIGVSNFLRHHLEDLMARCQVAPMLNQIEFHPYLVQQDLLDFCGAHGVQVQAWRPLMHGMVMDIAELQGLAQKYGRSVPQLVIRWGLQKGVATIPKSVNLQRILANSQVFDFELSREDMRAIDALDRDQRTGPHPDTFDF